MKTYIFNFPIRGITKSNWKPRGHYFLPKKFRDFERDLRLMAIQQMDKSFKPFQTYCEARLTFTFKNHVHSDGANLTKSVFDAFNKVLYKDDKLIRRHSVEVEYGPTEQINMVLLAWAPKS